MQLQAQFDGAIPATKEDHLPCSPKTSKMTNRLLLFGALLMGSGGALSSISAAQQSTKDAGLAPAHLIVRSLPHFINAISRAKPGDRIYIPGEVEIDLTGYQDLRLPGGVTLEGDRGVEGSKGALLFTDQMATSPLFLTQGDGVRITRLRLRGPDPEVGISAYWQPNSRGITCKNDGLRVDRCELSGWSQAAIFLDGATNARIDHNHIHHNRRRGLGYGVSHDGPATSLIEHNTFDFNRHDIAGTGSPGQGYEARYNTVLNGGTGHSFDMHGGADRKDGTNIAGDVIRIHNNTFLGRSFPAIVIRGIPQQGAWIDANVFAHDTESDAIRQENALGNLFLGPATYGFVSHSRSPFKNVGSWTLAGDGLDGWRLGDFNGDGRTDLLRYLPGVSGGDVFLSTGTSFEHDGSWTLAGNGSEGWYVGDFNGDGRDDLLRYVPSVSGADVFLSTGSEFKNAGSWTSAGNGSDGWHVGDFNGDLRDDLLRYVAGVSGGEVFLSTGSSFQYDGSWTLAGNGAQGWSVGDFNGDGRSDLLRYRSRYFGSEVFLSTGSAFGHSGTWTGNSGGSDGWYVGDFNGDGRSDVLQHLPGYVGGDVFLSNGIGLIGDYTWTLAGNGSRGWHVGDFDGDGKDEIFRYLDGVSGADMFISY